MTANMFKKGDRVVYVPFHANGNTHHVDCEHGIISSIGSECIFVKYDLEMIKMETGDEPYTAKSTRPCDLRYEL